MIYIQPTYNLIRPNLYILAGVCKDSKGIFKPVVKLVDCKPAPLFRKNYSNGLTLLQYPAHISEIELTLENEGVQFTKIIS